MIKMVTRESVNFQNDKDGYDDRLLFSDEVATFSLTFYTTVEFEEQTVDVPLFVDTAIADMNRWEDYNEDEG